MIYKLSNGEKSEAIKNLSFYNFSTYSLNWGYEAIIELNDSLKKCRYCDVQYNNYSKNVLNDYLKKERKIIKILNSIIESINEDILVFNIGEKWITNKRIAPKMNKFLIEADVAECESMLKITARDEMSFITRSILRYNTFAFFIIPSKKIIIAPTDHLDIFILSEFDIQNIIAKTIAKDAEIKQYTEV